MIIRVDCLESIVEDIATYLGVKEYQLCDDLKNFQSSNCENYDFENQKLIDYIRKNRKETLTEVYLCHVSRQIGVPDIPKLLPLQIVLTTKNSLSNFFAEHNIHFEYENGNLTVIHEGTQYHAEQLKGRLINRCKNDFCINGFPFLYDIKHNAGAYFRWYGSQPEFMYDIDHMFDLHLSQEFKRKSSVYCAMGRLSVNQVSFQSNEVSKNFEEEYIQKCLLFIHDYLYRPIPSGDNPIMYTSNQQIVPVESWIPESEIIMNGDYI